MKKKEFNANIYPFKLWIVVDESPVGIAEEFNDYKGNPIQSLEEDAANMEAFVMKVTTKEDPRFGAVVYFRSVESMNTDINVQMAVKAATQMFNHIGADTHESVPFEYAVCWVTNCCMEAQREFLNETV